MKKRPIVGISMKTYKNDYEENMEYVKELSQILSEQDSQVEVFYLPSLGLLHSMASHFSEENVKLGAQNIGIYPNGAQTGEFAIDVIDGFDNVKYIELGHAERRTLLNETLDMVADKVRISLDKGYHPVICIGEKEKYDSFIDLKKALTFEVLESLKSVEADELKKVVIAYEPYWAIGQAEAADAKYVHISHKCIRDIIDEEYGKGSSEYVKIIYGGSVSLDTVSSIVSDRNVDGVFVGRFGHNVKKFGEIVEMVGKIKNV